MCCYIQLEIIMNLSLIGFTHELWIFFPKVVFLAEGNSFGDSVNARGFQKIISRMSKMKLNFEQGQKTC